MAKQTNKPASQTAPAAAPAAAPKKGGRKSAPANETKADKFTRLAKARMSKALKAIKQLQALGGSGYESTEAQREKMISALQSAVKETAERLNRVKAEKDTGGFDF